MKFSEELRLENKDIFTLIKNHPFVEGIGKGILSVDAVRHYVQADYAYLNGFMKTIGSAIGNANHRNDIAYFSALMQFSLHDEIQAHLCFCEYINVNYEDLQGQPLPPTGDHYVKHMMYHAQTGTTGEAISALLPCPWTYYEIGKYLNETWQVSDNHPFQIWIQCYANTKQDVEEMCERLDEHASHASEKEKASMKIAFRKSCQLEYLFWEMAMSTEEWPSLKEDINNE